MVQTCYKTSIGQALILQYRFKRLEYNGLKGVIGEQLARSFVRNKLAPRLVKEEGWDHVVLSKNDYKQHAWTWNTKLFNFDYFREDFIKEFYNLSIIPKLI